MTFITILGTITSVHVIVKWARGLTFLFLCRGQLNMAKKKIGDYIAEWMKDFGAENGYEVHRTEFQKDGEAWYLRVYVDKLTGEGYGHMSSDDCEVVSKYLSDCLDREDPIKQRYYLEVSSPGLDRPLISDRDYERFAGSFVDIKLYKALNGIKQHSGKLIKKEGNSVTVECGEEELVFKTEEIAKINLTLLF